MRRPRLLELPIVFTNASPRSFLNSLLDNLVNLEPIVALSIRQPWTDLIIRGVKTMEIRSWRVQRRGLIALHAPRRIDFSAAYFFGYEKPWTLLRGKIVAVAEIADVINLDSESWIELVTMHRQPLPLVEGSYGVVLKNVQPLEHPVVCRGRQMLFPLADDVAARVRKQAGLSSDNSWQADEQNPQGGFFD